MIGEHNGSGYPLSYLMVTTTSKISPGAKKLVLRKWLAATRDMLGIQPLFVHTDKDIGEINAAREVWPESTHRLCWWHAQKALKARLAKSDLGTNHYESQLANRYFPFIDPLFVSAGNAKAPRTVSPEQVAPEPLFLNAALRIRFVRDNEGTYTASQSQSMAVSQSQGQGGGTQGLAERGDFCENCAGGHDPHLILLCDRCNSGYHTSCLDPPLVRIPPGAWFCPQCQEGDRLLKEVGSAGYSGLSMEVGFSKKGDKRVFCPAEFRGPLLDIFNRGFNSHPSIPGTGSRSCLSAKVIYYANVKDAYDFCVKRNLREVWAYLWNSWYRPSMWKLWARSTSEDVPRLRTTMMVESQCVFHSHFEGS
jgi:hypothetical protein